MKITKNELKEMINESVERQLRKTNYYNSRKKVNERSNTKYKYFPKNKKELKRIIKKQIKQFGNEVDLNNINTSKIKDMSYLFYNSNFNGDISKWNVSNVTDMSIMFPNSKFNGDISKWDVSSVTNMSWMFYESKFNQDISKWNVGNVRIMSLMFENSNFNRDISK